MRILPDMIAPWLFPLACAVENPLITLGVIVGVVVITVLLIRHLKKKKEDK